MAYISLHIPSFPNAVLRGVECALLVDVPD
jgi:hypothetical protein